MAARIVTAVFGVALLSGCSIFSPVENNMRVAVINQIPIATPEQSRLDATLLVLPPAINPIYDTIRMAYQAQPHQVDYFSKHEWGATPAQMLQPLLAQTFERTQQFRAVATPPYFGPYSYGLRTEILEFVQDFTSGPARFHLALRVQLVDGRSNRIIASRLIALQEPLIEQTPTAGVVAANKATASALEQTAYFIFEQIAQSEPNQADRARFSPEHHPGK
ncbi:membrane integrity-associated transporter subunit PqiC [Microbulbifer agarilyticus]|uniref:ABC-type transport auxiliary lipoprotein family protein n=1 Tax=Microbulbifer agarilyticus TaxID=260552 RepID=UPI001C955005|nr:ABC-type transport auxiliary lipoprotein family protein [Microbulbifer agarilyticus]MBY6189253.1 membrane integrity-associated transporter subunit PqiC [Microbulbifer agarilyticus]